ncbi:hypothetical protein ACD661_15600 [Legionella lytica]|uniref:Uncharacterized protein n=1 Tax=Legionella lytica TaxID=96232 RepID=A0ABW8DBA3_9GAMM
MNNSQLSVSQPYDLLRQLRICAHNLLIAYDVTLNNDLWIAFEKAIGVCEALMIQSQMSPPKTIH